MPFRRFYRRRFLNLRGHHAGAYVLADVSIENVAGPGQPPERWVEAGLTIADCGRVVTLDFDIRDAAGTRNALHKARASKEVVDGFIEALDRASDSAQFKG